MRNFFFSKARQTTRRRETSRRNFLRCEHLEGRSMLSGASPMAVNDLYQTLVDQPAEVGAAAGVLANDSDAEGDALTANLFTGPTNGELELAADGSFTYTPNSGFVGLDSFVYWASDGTSGSMLAAVTIRVGLEAEPPTATDDSYNVAEDGVTSAGLSDGLLANDTNESGLPMTASLVSGPVNGTLSLAADGSFTYIPNANFFGVDAFTYTANNSAGASAEATVSITVDPVNDEPTAENDAYTIDEDGSLSTTLPSILGNDSDPDGDTLTPIVESGPVNGTVVLNADGTFTYTPNADFNGVDGFSYFVNDGTSDSDVATVTISINSLNDLPAAVNDEYTLEEDVPLAIDVASGVLANDSDLEGDALSAIMVAPPVNGTVALNADGSFTYTPNANFNGTDGFSYLADDGQGQSLVATVTLQVSAVNDVPQAVGDAFTVAEDGTLNIDAAGGVLANDTDADLDTLAAALVSGPAHGSLTLNADGSFSYTPEANYNGSDSFTYTASDGQGGAAEATVSITVTPENDSPLAVADGYTTTEDTVFSIGSLGLLSNDSDVDGDTLTAALVSGPANGSVVVNADGSFEYTPNQNFHGEDAFVYSVSDGTLTSEAIVTMTVTPVNDSPTAADDSYAVDEDQTLTVDAAAGLLLNDSDVDGDALIASIATDPVNGSVSVNADGSFVYTPNANFNGSDTFTYTVSDGTLTATGTVSITINAIADAPIVGGDAYSTGEDVPLTVDATMGVLANDVASEGGALVAAVVTPPEHGTLTMNDDGSFSYTPEANWNGTVNFEYSATGEDGEVTTGTATIVVEPLNDAPVAADDSFDVDGEMTGSVMANDSDVDGNTLTAALIEGPSSGELTLNSDGSFTYSPEDGFEGDVSFRYQLNDGMANSNVATVTLHVADGLETSPPLSTPDAYTTDADTTLTVDAASGVLANDTGSGGSLTAVLVSNPGSGELTLNADGSFEYAPASGFSGQVSFTYKAVDGTVEGVETMVTIDVLPVETNTPPVAADDAYEVQADTTLTVGEGGILANDSDADGDALAANIIDAPTNGLVTLNADGSFSYVPLAGFSGTDTFTYQATDGADVSNTATVTINVAAVENSRPIAVNDEYTVTAGETTTINAAGVLTNDTDAQGDALTASLFSGPLHGSVTLNADGSFSYTPNEGYTGLDSFIYWAFDGELNSALAAVTLHVEGAAESPIPVDPPADDDEEDPIDCLVADESLDPWAIDAALEGEDWLA